MLAENQIINGLWIGNRLSPLEMLCLKSFVYHGHQFQLWLYEPLQHPIPQGVIVKDAHEIVPKEAIFAYKKTNQFGHGKGSYAGFSDIFRYKLLYEKGGWWVDMDITCLQPFLFETPYVFRTHHKLPVVGNILKCPPKSPLMWQCYVDAKSKVDANNTNWMLPINILNENINKLGLQQYIFNLSNRDSWYDIRNLLRFALPKNKDWFAIHWNNEELQKNNIAKHETIAHSALHELCEKYQNPISVLKNFQSLSYHWKLTIPYYVYNRLLKQFT